MNVETGVSEADEAKHRTMPQADLAIGKASFPRTQSGMSIHASPPSIGHHRFWFHSALGMRSLVDYERSLPRPDAA
jgi:hypothetical protein